MQEASPDKIKKLVLPLKLMNGMNVLREVNRTKKVPKYVHVNKIRKKYILKFLWIILLGI